MAITEECAQGYVGRLFLAHRLAAHLRCGVESFLSAGETDAPLVIDADGVLATTVAGQRLYGMSQFVRRSGG